MKTVTLLLALLTMTAMLAFPAIVPAPVLAPDGQTVSDLSPGLGRKVFAIPGSVWNIWWNDNQGRGDYDFNDLVVQVSFSPIDATGLVAGILGSVSANANEMYDPANAILLANAGGVVNPALGAFIAGQEVIPVMRSSGLAYPVYTGPGSRNADGTIHAWTEEITGIPEPSTYVLVGVGLLGIAVIRRRRRRS